MKIKIILLFTLLSTCLFSSDILILDSKNDHPLNNFQLDIINKFYGLSYDLISVDDSMDGKLQHPKSYSSYSALIINFSVFLNEKNSNEIDKLINQRSSRLPILFFNVSKGNSNQLSKYVEGSINYLESDNFKNARRLEVSNYYQVCRQLGGQVIEQPSVVSSFLKTDNNSDFYPIIKLQNNKEDRSVFLLYKHFRREIFFLVQNDFDFKIDKREKFLEKNFLSIFPLMMYLRYIYQDKCWHTDNHFANLTIDDPWLIEPYGYLNYSSLLAEMKKVRFHTTIAFIPYNYNRSKSDVIYLFRNYKDYFSICVHGNDHTPKEFVTDSFNSRKQIELKTMSGLVRMQQFNSLTGLAFDNIFVFPRNEMSPEVFDVLKRYNYTATINADNLSDNKIPIDLLKNYTSKFYGFPSFSRYACTQFKNIYAAIDLFLDNPVFLYAHQKYFKSGIKSFNSTADSINKIEPGIIWENPGEVIKQYYLIQRTSISNYNINLISNSAEIVNPYNHEIILSIRKENFDNAAKLKTNRKLIYSIQKNNRLVINYKLAPNDTLRLNIAYNNITVKDPLLLIKNSKSIIFRSLCDIRDIFLSQISFYSVLRFLLITVVVIILLFSFVLVVRRLTSLLDLNKLQQKNS